MAEGIVLLQSRDKLGKQLIREHGVYWDVLWYNENSTAFNGDEPAYWIQSRVDEHEKRWIKPDGRPHFFASYSRGTGKSQLDTRHDQTQPNEV